MEGCATTQVKLSTSENPLPSTEVLGENQKTTTIFLVAESPLRGKNFGSRPDRLRALGNPFQVREGRDRPLTSASRTSPDETTGRPRVEVLGEPFSVKRGFIKKYFDSGT